MAQRRADSAERTPSLTDEQQDHLQGYDREMNLLMYAGIWCDDCSRTGPLLRALDS